MKIKNQYIDIPNIFALYISDLKCSSLDALLKLFKETSSPKLFDYDCITLYDPGNGKYSVLMTTEVNNNFIFRYDWSTEIPGDLRLQLQPAGAPARRDRGVHGARQALPPAQQARGPPPPDRQPHTTLPTRSQVQHSIINILHVFIEKK